MTVLRNLFLLSACVTTPVFAQTAAPDDTARRDDIIVTGRNFVAANAVSATKSDAPILSTPQAISVVKMSTK